jgi:hypothetical protein
MYSLISSYSKVLMYNKAMKPFAEAACFLFRFAVFNTCEHEKTFNYPIPVRQYAH